MTSDEIASYYSSLLILQYHGKPNASAFIKALVTPVIMNQLPIAIQNAFQIGSAQGVQLDVIGKYVGVSRNVTIATGPITLNDSDFTQLIKLVIIQNNAGSSLGTIESLIAANFPGQILISDNQAMGLNYLLVETLGTSNLLNAIVYGGYLPAPMGVQTSATIVPSHSLPYFGFTSYAGAPSGYAYMNNYATYNTNSIWLK